MNNIAYLFDTCDPVIYHLENFSNTKYLDKIETERLILTKSKKSDFSSIIYFVRLKETENLVGEITILCNGKIYYKIPKKYQNQGYIQEALNKFKEIITRKELSLDVGDKNLIEEQVAKDMGFELSDVDLEGIRTYKFVKQPS
jgi:RimJ/RimL family protein N-acetyltransferase